MWMPNLLSSFCAQGAEVGGASGSLPRRSLEDYEEVRPWDTSVDGPASGRHVMLRARFDGEDVVLKVRDTGHTSSTLGERPNAPCKKREAGVSLYRDVCELGVSEGGSQGTPPIRHVEADVWCAVCRGRATRCTMRASCGTWSGRWPYWGQSGTTASSVSRPWWRRSHTPRAVRRCPCCTCTSPTAAAATSSRGRHRPRGRPGTCR